MDAQAFLELLARHATPVEFERPVLDARSAGADPGEIATLEQAKTLALRVRATLDERRRREAELSALVDTASDLAALRDVDAVLSAIVHRARGLLGADIAYLSYSDAERGDTYMRVTDGSVSARFQKLRLPMGAGLGGLVAQTATPYVTADYFADERFRHTHEIDTAVHEEGLVAILGVPLLLGTRVLGVLYAANRSERPFSRDEVALLVTLAAHAAVAIDTARLLEETRAALAELEQANELVRKHSAAVERAADAHDQLTDLVLRGGRVEEVAIAIGRVLDGPLCVLDDEGRQLAAVGDVRLPQAAQLTAAVQESRQGGRAVLVDGCWVAGVVAGAQHLGALVLDGQPQLGDADQRVLERAAVVTALLLLMRRSVADAETRVRGDLLNDLLDGTSQDDADVLRERAKRVGVDLDVPHAVVVAEMREPVARDRLAFAAAQVATQRGGLASGRARTVVLLLPGAEPGAAATAVSAELTTAVGRPVTAGAAGPASGPAAIKDVAVEARRCLGALLALNRVGEGAGGDELGFVGLLLGGGRDVEGFVQRHLGPLLDYDRRRGTDLVTTLEVYFAAGSSLARTKDRLHVHVNTVTQRLERMGKLLGEGWQAPERALELQLALRLHRLS